MANAKEKVGDGASDDDVRNEAYRRVILLRLLGCPATRQALVEEFKSQRRKPWGQMGILERAGLVERRSDKWGFKRYWLTTEGVRAAARAKGKGA